MNIEHNYLTVLEDLASQSELHPNRTGVATYKLPPQTLQHDMQFGFPLLTTKKVLFDVVKVELEGFIKGITSKKWFQERKCNIWNSWANPQKAPYSTDEESQKKMAQEDDLGAIYGAQWRGFCDPEGGNQKIDQLKNIIDTLAKNPNDRRMICLAWNPLAINHAALPACHALFQVTTRNNKLDLTWYQRSCDWFLGVPFNLASYGLLLHLIAKTVNMQEGILTGFFTDVHLYHNHLEAAKIQLSRPQRPLPTIQTEDCSLFDWTHDKTTLLNYKPHPFIKAQVSI